MLTRFFRMCDMFTSALLRQQVSRLHLALAGFLFWLNNNSPIGQLYAQCRPFRKADDSKRNRNSLVQLVRLPSGSVRVRDILGHLPRRGQKISSRSHRCHFVLVDTRHGHDDALDDFVPQKTDSAAKQDARRNI